MAAKSNKEKEKGTKKPTGRNEAAGGGAGANSSSGGGGVNTPGGDEFGRAVANTAVAQICEGLGFHGIQRTASETLADIALRYLSDLGKAAHFYANLCGRTECNAFDVILAMEDMGPGSGVDTSTKCLANSSTLRDVMRYVEYAEEIPFARPVPHFPVQKKRAPPPSFAQLGEEPPLPHIPSWLPAFPDPHTYQSTPVWNERKSDPHMDKLEQARQRRKAERSLVSLHLRMSANGGASAAEAQPSSAGDGVRVPSQQQQQQQPSGRTIPGVAGASPGWGGSGAMAVVGDPQSHSRQQWPSREQEALLAKAGTEGPAGKGKGKRPISSAQNPFLAQPLPAGEKEVAPVALAGKWIDNFCLSSNRVLQVIGTLRREFVPYDFPIVILHTKLMMSFQLWCMIKGRVCISMKSNLFQAQY